MVLHIDSDAAYLIRPEAKSRLAGFYYLSNASSQSSTPTTPFLNGVIHIECKALRHVVFSAAEAETAALFHNAKTAPEIRHILRALDHIQPPTPLKTDNSTAEGYVRRFVHLRRSKSWDMRYHWLRERNNKDFLLHWAPGCQNHADYYTKHHAPAYHKQVCTRYILQGFHTLVNKVLKTLHSTMPARVCSYTTMYHPSTLVHTCTVKT